MKNFLARLFTFYMVLQLGLAPAFANESSSKQLVARVAGSPALEGVKGKKRALRIVGFLFETQKRWVEHFVKDHSDAELEAMLRSSVERLREKGKRNLADRLQTRYLDGTVPIGTTLLAQYSDERKSEVLKKASDGIDRAGSVKAALASIDFMCLEDFDAVAIRIVLEGIQFCLNSFIYDPLWVQIFIAVPLLLFFFATFPIFVIWDLVITFPVFVFEGGLECPGP